MQATGLPMPSAQPQAVVGAAAPTPFAKPQPMGSATIGGTMSLQSVSEIQAQAKRESEQNFQDQQAQPVITGLAGHVKGFFEVANMAKLDVQNQMLEALYARRGEYPADKLQQIREQGHPAIYMMLASVKMRQAESLIRDVMIGAGTEKPWTITPEPVAELPPFEINQIHQAVTTEVQQAIQQGFEPDMQAIRDRLQSAKDELVNSLHEAAVAHAERMEDKMETQLDEGGFNEALDEWITDLTTFKTAFICGPIVRNKAKLTWGPDNQPVVTTALSLEWERVSPFDMYPAPWAKSLKDKTPLIRKHKLSRENLTELIGVEGYSEDGIRAVLDVYGIGGLSDWLSVDSQVARAEGKLTLSSTTHTNLIDALQYWGTVSGQMLRDWGMTAVEVPDVAKEYQVEAWVIGPYVIKAVLNDDPLARRPVYGNSYERIPGSVWGHSVYDLMRDCQDMCNAAARSLAANLGISSGPQVAINVTRLPQGEQVTQMFPWKVWQFEADPMGGTQPPIQFFQPSSNAAELMGVYEKFSSLADEYTGIPKYMTGTEGTPGAGRTASGLSMMIGNASKIIKQVVGSIDQHLLTPLLERLYYYNMRYGDDPDLKGSIGIQARGAMSLTTKESAQVRRNEFLQATMNPIDTQIMGLQGRAEVLRAAASTLDLNVDKVVPSVAVLKDRQKQTQMAQAAAAAKQMQLPGAGQPGVPPQGAQPGGPSPSGQQLTNGAPVTDQFQPVQQGPSQ